VTAFTATTTGFTVQFNGTLDPATVHLFGALTPDITVTGSGGNVVQGSVVIAGNTLTFVASDAVGNALLPADTYTVTLVSGTAGFKDVLVRPLDGSGSGVLGSTANYVNTFTVQPTTARIVSVAQFARGPGQAVNLPATGAGLPLTLSDATGVTNLKVQLTYNPSMLTINASNIVLPAGVTFNSAPVLANGTLTLDLNFAGLSGPVQFAFLDASVPANAPYGAAEVLDLHDIQINGGAIAAEDQDGVHAVAYLGDAGALRHYSSQDASLIAQEVNGGINGFAAFPLISPVVIAGDADGVAGLSMADAVAVNEAAAGLPVPTLPPIP
jgi:hypothetical protein